MYIHTYIFILGWWLKQQNTIENFLFDYGSESDAIIDEHLGVKWHWHSWLNN
jgi:hypothetical protein